MPFLMAFLLTRICSRLLSGETRIMYPSGKTWYFTNSMLRMAV